MTGPADRHPDHPGLRVVAYQRSFYNEPAVLVHTAVMPDLTAYGYAPGGWQIQCGQCGPTLRHQASQHSTSCLTHALEAMAAKAAEKIAMTKEGVTRNRYKVLVATLRLVVDSPPETSAEYMREGCRATLEKLDEHLEEIQQMFTDPAAEQSELTP